MKLTMDNNGKIKNLDEWITKNHILVVGVLKYYQKNGKRIKGDYRS